MADEIVPAGGAPMASAASAEPAPAPTPVVAAPAVAEVPVVEAAPAVVPTSEVPSLLEGFTTPPPVVEPAPEAEAKPADGEKPAEAPAEAPPAEKPVEGEKPAEAPPAEGEKPAEAAAEPVEPPPVEYKYEAPEGLEIPDEMRGKLHTAFDELRIDPNKGAQSLLALHVEAIQQAEARALQDQHRVFNQTRTDWRTQVTNDPEIGRGRHDTAMKAIARVRDTLISSHKPGTPEYAADAADFDMFLRITGAGDNPVFLKALHRAARFLDEGTPPQPGAKPSPTNGMAPGSRRERMYTHPSSNKDS